MTDECQRKNRALMTPQAFQIARLLMRGPQRFNELRDGTCIHQDLMGRFLLKLIQAGVVHQHRITRKNVEYSLTKLGVSWSMHAVAFADWIDQNQVSINAARERTAPKKPASASTAHERTDAATNKA
jgi:DNA-binding HxlR family transcriptional regulator